MLPLLLVTPVIAVKRVSAGTVPTVKPLLSRKEIMLPAPVLLAASVPLTLLLATSRVTSPTARTPRLAPVMTPAAVCDRPVPELSRTVAVPALTAAPRAIGPI